ncbi:hypothetical protein VFPBJ_10906 [Purpureocillium lilacinum]|uniref:Uncharacterized protein n=1 Tax=Purpureocillium lilacinum TaxID=33203 RepID=A0A179FWN8_PURLI|nr:hypothetical protein VFPBJ_10906 [Purpureocillium lilacinum]
MPLLQLHVMSVSETRAGYPAACAPAPTPATAVATPDRPATTRSPTFSRSACPCLSSVVQPETALHRPQLAQRRDPWAPVPGFRISARPRSPTSRAACLSLTSQWVAADAALPLEARRVLSHIIQRREADAASRRRSRTAKPDGRRLTKLWKKQWIPALMPRVLTGVPESRLSSARRRGAWPKARNARGGLGRFQGERRPSQRDESLKIPARPSAASLTDSAAVHSPRTERSPPPCGGEAEATARGPVTISRLNGHPEVSGTG